MKNIDKLAQLEGQLRKLKVFKKDLSESYTLSSGPGGQNVNKVATCVHLMHTLSGLNIKAQKFRTQIANRIYARELLREKIIQQENDKIKQAKSLKAKIKRQNRKRSKRAKEKMLENKRKNAEKKSLRKKVDLRILGGS